MAVIKITKDNFEEKVMNSDVPVMIDFWAEWCGPCRMFSPVVEELGEEMDNAKICKVNVDDEPEIAGKFGIMSIPTVVIIKNGEVVNTAVGVQSKEAVKKMLEE